MQDKLSSEEGVHAQLIFALVMLGALELYKKSSIKLLTLSIIEKDLFNQRLGVIAGLYLDEDLAAATFSLNSIADVRASFPDDSLTKALDTATGCFESKVESMLKENNGRLFYQYIKNKIFSKVDTIRLAGQVRFVGKEDWPDIKIGDIGLIGERNNNGTYNSHLFLCRSGRSLRVGPASRVTTNHRIIGVSRALTIAEVADSTLDHSVASPCDPLGALRNLIIAELRFVHDKVGHE